MESADWQSQLVILYVEHLIWSKVSGEEVNSDFVTTVQKELNLTHEEIINWGFVPLLEKMWCNPN